MTGAIRTCVLAAGAAALLSTQAVYAAPVPTAPAVDPLVSLSVLGTAQSRAAVCGSGVSCALPMTATAAAAVQVQDDDDSLPPPPPPPGKRIGVLPVAIAFLVMLALGIALLSGGDKADGNLTPISPA